MLVALSSYYLPETTLCCLHLPPWVSSKGLLIDIPTDLEKKAMIIRANNLQAAETLSLR